jgi:hypothetical protein
LDILNNDDEFFSSLQEFRKLYKDEFISPIEIQIPKPEKKSATLTKKSTQVDTRSPGIQRGYYRVNSHLEIEQHHHRRLEVYDEEPVSWMLETEAPVKVSIPSGVIPKPPPSKRLEPKTNSQFCADLEELDSVFLGDVSIPYIVFAQGLQANFMEWKSNQETKWLRITRA